MAFAYPAAALLTGFILDMLFGDPQGFPHIVRFMGGLIAALEKALRAMLPPTEQGERRGGALLVIIVSLICWGVPFAALSLSYRVSPLLGYAMESFLCYQLLAVKSLKAESMKIYRSLQGHDVESARRGVSMIVGRDTAALDREGILRAAVETVAENASDGVAAPMFYMALGGAALGCLYKAVNTMDSMVGYKNDQYLHFGRAAAKTDDVLSLIPSRMCALLMIACAYLPGFDGRGAFRIWRRDRRKHPSPNSAQTESVCAGALGIRLAGPASYMGVAHDKPYIGDDTRPIRDDDIISANRLMAAASVLALALAVLFRILCWGGMW
jgi:adenosylcobinamide-phosphate synthase